MDPEALASKHTLSFYLSLRSEALPVSKFRTVKDEVGRDTLSAPSRLSHSLPLPYWTVEELILYTGLCK